MKDKPLVSVIMPFFNEEKFISKAIESILNQSYSNVELIAIDDYSTDRSLEIAREFALADSRVKVITKTKEQKRAGVSRNIGFNSANGDYIAFQDADDICAPTRIEIQLSKALEKPGRLLVGCNVEIIKEDETRVTKLPQNNEEILKGINRWFGRGNYFIMGTALGPTQIFKNNPSKEVLRYVEDWDQLLRIVEEENVELYNVQEVLYFYNQVGGISDYKPGWIEANLFVRFSQRMRKKNHDDPITKLELIRYLKKHPLEFCMYKMLKWTYLVNSAFAKWANLKKL